MKMTKKTPLEIATLLGLTKRRILQLQASGDIPGGARLDLGQAVRAYCHFLKRSTATSALSAARVRRLSAQSDLDEMNLQERAGELIPLDLAEDFIGKFLSAAKQRIISNLKLDDDEKDKILRELQGCCEIALEFASKDGRLLTAGH